MPQQKNKPYRFIFDRHDKAIAKCIVTPEMNGTIELIIHPINQAKEGDIEKILKKSYPDILGLKLFLKEYPTLRPDDSAVKNACAKAGFSPFVLYEDKKNGIFESRRLYLQDGYTPTEEDLEWDKMFKRNNPQITPRQFCTDVSPPPTQKGGISTPQP